MRAAAAEIPTEATETIETPAKPRPLDGLRVIDLSRFIAGPFAARLLADLGADVVKIEPPSGDVTRLFGVVREGLSGLYVQQNAGKWEVLENIATERGARTIAVDEKTHKVYLPTAKSAPTPSGGRATFLPDSFKVLVVGK